MTGNFAISRVGALAQVYRSPPPAPAGALGGCAALLKAANWKKMHPRWVYLVDPGFLGASWGLNVVDLNQELVKNGSDNQFVKILATLFALFALLFASQPACALSYTNLIPTSIWLVDHSGLATPGGKVCVIGYSVAGGSPSQPAYYLSVARGTTGQWKQVPAGTSRAKPQLVTAYQLGKEINTITTSPSSRLPYINSVRITFGDYPIDTSMRIWHSFRHWSYADDDS